MSHTVSTTFVGELEREVSDEEFEKLEERAEEKDTSVEELGAELVLSGLVQRFERDAIEYVDAKTRVDEPSPNADFDI